MKHLTLCLLGIMLTACTPHYTMHWERADGKPNRKSDELQCKYETDKAALGMEGRLINYRDAAVLYGECLQARGYVTKPGWNAQGVY